MTQIIGVPVGIGDGLLRGHSSQDVHARLGWRMEIVNASVCGDGSAGQQRGPRLPPRSFPAG